MAADFFTVACRTGGPGSGGLSFVLVERGMPGVAISEMRCQVRRSLRAFPGAPAAECTCVLPRFAGRVGIRDGIYYV